MRKWHHRLVRADKAIGVWPLAIAGLLVTSIYGVFLTYGLFLVALLEDFGGSRAFAAGAYSVYPVMFAVGSVLFSRMADRYGPDRVILLGAALVAVGFGLSGLATEAWQLYIFFGLVAGLGSGTLWAPPISAVLAGVERSNRHRGIAVSLATGGMPLGVLALPPLTGFLITIYGWRLAFTALGIISFALAVPAVLTMKRGLADAARTQTLPNGNRKDREGFSLRDAISSRSFWTFYTVYASNAICFALVLVHLPPFATDLGFQLTSAGLILGLAGLGNFIGRFLFTPPLMHLTEKTVLFLTATLQVVLVAFLLAFGAYGSVVIVYTLLFGIFYGAVIPQYPLLAEKYFGAKAYSSVFGILSTAFGVGFVGPLTGGFIHDLSGSYTLAFIILGALFALSAVCSLLLQSPRPRRGVPHVVR